MLHPLPQPIGAAFYDAIAAVAVVSAAIAVVFRVRLLRPAFAQVRTDPNDAAANKRWRAGSFVSYALALSVALYGCELRLRGTATAQALPFYVGGFVLMLLWWPRRP